MCKLMTAWEMGRWMLKQTAGEWENQWMGEWLDGV